MQIYLYNGCQLHSVECVPKINSLFSIIFHAIYGTGCIELTIVVIMRVIILLSATSRKYELIAIV